jgi:hypothetical protein
LNAQIHHDWTRNQLAVTSKLTATAGIGLRGGSGETSSAGQEFDGKRLTDKVNLAGTLLEMLANGSVIVYGIFREVQFVNGNF